MHICEYLNFGQRVCNEVKRLILQLAKTCQTAACTVLKTALVRREVPWKLSPLWWAWDGCYCVPASNKTLGHLSRRQHERILLWSCLRQDHVVENSHVSYMGCDTEGNTLLIRALLTHYCQEAKPPLHHKDLPTALRQSVFLVILPLACGHCFIVSLMSNWTRNPL